MSYDTRTSILILRRLRTDLPPELDHYFANEQGTLGTAVFAYYVAFLATVFDDLAQFPNRDEHKAFDFRVKEALGRIEGLWRSIPAARLLHEWEGDRIVVARECSIFSVGNTHYRSACSAAFSVAEEELSEAYHIVRPYKPCPAWKPFSRFERGRWRESLEALHTYCAERRQLGTVPDWNRIMVGVEQEIACLKVRFRPPEATKAEAKPGPDFRSVHWFGTDYRFTANQAACIKVLWKAWEQGTPEVGDATILEEAGVSSERLSIVFRGHPAWGTMICQGATKGTHQLAAPNP